ncbi:hypothetical protein [Vandammella animalimorsus]|uniref:Uncharacterized protein n=1 Tax=Vandammella animalimorsus TaxID=2029117 RepID=A0A2A2AXK2_9BURK|nr:hypothetical protein [Vandammella animalimorsus]PAT42458.1 hypothetical protein CK621_08940 [Vandammella animalimorsus]RRD66772.1 hypothetical protein EII19_08900 [Comamonadaceae bacterium OH2310_COT-174]
MVILATTRQGFESLRALIDTGAHPVWVGASVLTAGEIQTWRARGLDLTVFDHDIDPRHPGQLAAALDTVAEHYPGEVVWVDAR